MIEKPLVKITRIKLPQYPGYWESRYFVEILDPNTGYYVDDSNHAEYHEALKRKMQLYKEKLQC